KTQITPTFIFFLNQENYTHTHTHTLSLSRNPFPPPQIQSSAAVMSDSTASEHQSAPAPSSATAVHHLYPRREPFEHGLLPITKLIFTDGAQTLSQLKSTLLSSNPTERVDFDTLSRALQIPLEHARLLIETISSVLHSESDPLVEAGGSPDGLDGVGVNVYDLLVFLYIQSYKRLLPKGHKDSAAVADVWPSTSAFDGVLSTLSPLQSSEFDLIKRFFGLIPVLLQVVGGLWCDSELAMVQLFRLGMLRRWLVLGRLVRSNSRKFIPSQADEESHQLSYLQKHIGNILSLLADPTEGEGEESLVLSMDKFEHLGFLLYFGEKGSVRIPLSQSTPFFANSDPDMPAAPVPASQVLDWLLQNIASTLEFISDRVSPKDNVPNSSSDQDVQMADVGTSHLKPSSSSRGPSFIEGISKSSCVKQASDLKGTSAKVVNCHESVIYVLAPLKYATVYGCSDATIVIGAVGKAIRVEHCERVHLITAARRICIANCRECVFFLGVNQRPLIVGDNHKLQTGSTKHNPFLLPDAYLQSQQKNMKNLEEVKQMLRETNLEDSRKRELSSALHACFKEWLYGNAFERTRHQETFGSFTAYRVNECCAPSTT
ncbi:tubulin binding cofactor C, partial [Striga asiatica]